MDETGQGQRPAGKETWLLPKALTRSSSKTNGLAVFNEAEGGQVALPGYFWNNRRVAEDTSAVGREDGWAETFGWLMGWVS